MTFMKSLPGRRHEILVVMIDTGTVLPKSSIFCFGILELSTRRKIMQDQENVSMMPAVLHISVDCVVVYKKNQPYHFYVSNRNIRKESTIYFSESSIKYLATFSSLLFVTGSVLHATFKKATACYIIRSCDIFTEDFVGVLSKIYF